MNHILPKYCPMMPGHEHMRVGGKNAAVRHSELFSVIPRDGAPVAIVGCHRAAWTMGCSWDSLRRYFRDEVIPNRVVNGEALTIRRTRHYVLGAPPWACMLPGGPTMPDRRHFRLADIEALFGKAPQAVLDALPP